MSDHLSITASWNKNKRFLASQEFAAKLELDMERTMADRHLHNILKTYFDVPFAVGLCPFRLTRNSTKTHKYIIRTWWPQTLLCILLHGLVLLFYFGNIRYGYFDLTRSKKHPYNFFLYGTILGKIILVLINLWQFWFGRVYFINLINFLAHPKNCLPLISKKIATAIKIIFWGHLIFICVAKRCLIFYRDYKSSAPYYMLAQYRWGRFYLYFDKLPITQCINGTTRYLPYEIQGHGFIGLALIYSMAEFCA